VEGIRMTTKPYKQLVKTDNKGHKEIWEWEETPEFVEALQNYYKTVRSNDNAVPVPIPPNKKADA